MSSATTAILDPQSGSTTATRPLARAGTVCAGIAVIAGMALAVAMPDLAPWINDEPKLLSNALLANSEGRLAHIGLMGSFKICYGPAPTWFYQALLAITHQIGAIITLHAILFYTATLAAAAWLGKELKLSLAFLAILALSPAICFYSRQIWDNSFNIPLSMALLACYARLLNKPAAWAGIVLGALAVLSLTVHLSAAPMVAGVGLHALWRQRPLLKQVWMSLLVGAVACAIPFTPYIYSQGSILAGAVAPPERVQIGLAPGYPYESKNMTPIQSAFYVLTGTRALTADFSMMPRFNAGAEAIAQNVARYGSWLLHGLFAVGVIGLLRAIVISRGKQQLNVATEIALVGLVILILQASFFVSLSPIAAEHYFNGTFVIYPLLAWFSLERLPVSLGQAAVWTTALCLGIATVLSLTLIHRTGGSQLGYGPTLGEQRLLLGELRSMDVTRIQTDVTHFVYFPQGLWTLARLENPGGSLLEPKNGRIVPFVTAKDDLAGQLNVVQSVPADRADRAVVFDLAKPVPWLQ